MDRRRVGLSIAGILVAGTVAVLLASRFLFGPETPVLGPLGLLVSEPFAWIVVAALVVAALGHAYIE